MYNSQTGRWNGIDPMAEKFAYESPFNYAGNNPVKNIDIEGMLKLQYDETQLKANGVSYLGLQRFQSIVQNISNIVVDNPQALMAIQNTTGFSKERILRELKYNSGPTIEITSYGMGARGGSSGIVFDYSILKDLGEAKGEDLYQNVLATALTVLHEYGHYGDQTTNNGKNSGQFDLGTGERLDDDYDIPFGTQKWKSTITGHRGRDVEVEGFGVQVYGNKVGKPSSNSRYIDFQGIPKPPKRLPENMNIENLFKTLKLYP